MARSGEQQAGEEDVREIAEKVRDLARQTQIPEAREELFARVGLALLRLSEARQSLRPADVNGALTLRE